MQLISLVFTLKTPLAEQLRKLFQPLLNALALGQLFREMAPVALVVLGVLGTVAQVNVSATLVTLQLHMLTGDETRFVFSVVVLVLQERL